MPPRFRVISVSFLLAYICRFLPVFLSGGMRFFLDFHLENRYSIFSLPIFSAPSRFPECDGSLFAHRYHFEGVAAMTCRYSNAKYMTIAEIIARRLRAGEFLNEKVFYSRDELAKAYHIAPGTAHPQAYRQVRRPAETPPRVWGRPLFCRHACRYGRNTPTCVGKTKNGTRLALFD